ncbi:helix-turn-helix domain-containing protein [Sphingomonas sp. BE138]|uniref:helix-turn-helix domain-containing protein n=1 Tax=Sphingomonas sp. BE138 TaxID=2817845 RepID=UPI003870060C
MRAWREARSICDQPGPISSRRSRPVRCAPRALLDWPAEKLAEMAGVSRSTIRRLENGEATTSPRRGSIKKILSVLARQSIRCVGQDGVIEGVLDRQIKMTAETFAKSPSHSTH